MKLLGIWAAASMLLTLLSRGQTTDLPSIPSRLSVSEHARNEYIQPISISLAPRVLPRIRLRRSPRWQVTAAVATVVSIPLIMFLIVQCFFRSSPGHSYAMSTGPIPRTLAAEESPCTTRDSDAGESTSGGHSEGGTRADASGKEGTIEDENGDETTGGPEFMETGAIGSAPSQASSSSQQPGDADEELSLSLLLRKCFRGHEKASIQRLYTSVSDLRSQLQTLRLSQRDTGFLNEEERQRVGTAQRLLLGELSQLKSLIRCHCKKGIEIESLRRRVASNVREEHQGCGSATGHEKARSLLIDAHEDEHASYVHVLKQREKLREYSPHSRQSARTLTIIAQRYANGEYIPHSAAFALSTAEHVLGQLESDVIAATELEEAAVKDMAENLVYELREQRELLSSHLVVGEAKPALTATPWLREASQMLSAAAAVSKRARDTSREMRYLRMTSETVGLAPVIEAANLALGKVIDRVFRRMMQLRPVDTSGGSTTEEPSPRRRKDDSSDEGFQILSSEEEEEMVAGPSGL